MIRYNLNRILVLNIIISFSIFLAIFVRLAPVIEDIKLSDSELKIKQNKFINITGLQQAVRGREYTVSALSQPQLTQLPEVMEGFSRKYGLGLLHWESLNDAPEPVSSSPLSLARFRVSLEVDDVQKLSEFLAAVQEKLPAVFVTSYRIDAVKKIAEIEINAILSEQKVKRVFAS